MPADKPAGLLTTKEIAHAYKVSVNAVTNWIQDGCPWEEKGGRGKSYLFDPAKVQAWRDRKSTQLDPMKERARKDKAAADNMEIRNQVLIGELVTRADVIELWADMVGNARAKLLSLPTRLATVAVSCSDLEEIQHAAKAIIDEALAELAGDPVPGGKDLDAAAEPDGESVGGPVSETQPGSVSGTGPVEH